MKTFFILVWCLIPAVVFADFRPGRVRAVAHSNMDVVQATGAYEGLKNVKLVLFAEDGVGVVKLLLQTADKDILLPIDKVNNTGCGNYAFPEAYQSEIGYSVAMFSDYSEMICARYEEKQWKISIETKDNDGEISLFEAEGKPEYYNLTM